MFNVVLGHCQKHWPNTKSSPITIYCTKYFVAHSKLSVGGGPRVVVSTAAFHARVRGSVPGLGGLKETKLFLPHPRVKVSIVGSLRDREVACSASDRQGSNFESCVWRTVSSQSSHHPQEVLLAQFSLYVHKGGLKPDSFHFQAVCTNQANLYTICGFDIMRQNLSSSLKVLKCMSCIVTLKSHTVLFLIHRSMNIDI